jgi:transcriptional regulator with XRE-family HTH domain
MTITELARRSGVHQSTLSRLESGETVGGRSHTIDQIASGLDVPVSAILGREPPPRAVPVDMPPDRHQIPIVRVPAHAGLAWNAMEIGWEATGEAVDVSDDDVRGRQLLAARVLGDCMIPDLLPGDIVLFDTWDRTKPQDGQMVVCTHERELLVRWVRVEVGGILLVANQGPIITVNGDTVIEGVVYRSIRDRPRKRWEDPH